MSKECTKHTITLCDEYKMEVKKAMAKHPRESRISDGVNWIIEDYIKLKKRLGIQ